MADAGPGPRTQSDDEDDYLTMTFEEPSQNTKIETLTQRKKRLAREAEERSRPKSKAQIAVEEKAKRDAALSKTSLDTSSKGFKMMAALGYKPGTALGSKQGKGEEGGKDSRLLEPIGLEQREGRGGIGADAEKKRKIREAFEEQERQGKKVKVDEGDYRERRVKEMADKRMDGQFWSAMKVAERLDEEEDTVTMEKTGKTRRSKPLSQTNVLWRGLVKQRLLNERDRRMRYDLHQSLSRLPTYEDPDEDADDKIALGKKDTLEVVDLELDHDDAELDALETLEIGERLDKLVQYLRTRWHYCFWCKYRYANEQMEGCPGSTEAEHD